MWYVDMLLLYIANINVLFNVDIIKHVVIISVVVGAMLYINVNVIIQ